MKVLDPGHVYELRQLGDSNTQRLTFIKRSGGAIKYAEEWPGLQTQEVLRALIDRTEYLNEVLPCKETLEALKHLRATLYWYEVRAFRRKHTKVNRTAEQHDDSDSDVPFTEEGIEEREIGEDGHLLV